MDYTDDTDTDPRSLDLFTFVAASLSERTAPHPPLAPRPPPLSP